MRTLLSILLLSFLILGCSPKEPLVEYTPTPLPSWYLNPPANSEQYLYGLGEGKNLKEARSNALEAMLSQLGVSISSRYESKLQSKGVYHQFLSKDVTYTLKEEVSKIRISNYQLLQSHKQAYNHFIVLLRSDKKDFAQGLHKVLNSQITKIRSDLSACAQRDVLFRFNLFTQSLEKLEVLLPNTLILSGLDSTYKDKNYLETITKVNQDLQTLQKTMTFSISADKNSLAYKDEIQVALSEKGIQLINKASSNKNHVHIILRTSTQYSQTQGFQIVKAALVVELKDTHDKLIAGNKIRLTGQAVQTQALALENSSIKLQKIISKSDIFQVLGLKEIF